MKGDNYALKYVENAAAYKSMGYSMMAQTIINAICLFVGLISPKFIGLESILNLQLIFYSQLLIFDISKIPPGFVFLKYLKYAAGYNEVFEITGFYLVGNAEKKLRILGMNKLIVENFNINFIVLALSFMVLLGVFFYVKKK